MRVIEDFISSLLKIGRAAQTFRMQRFWNGARVKGDSTWRRICRSAPCESNGLSMAMTEVESHEELLPRGFSMCFCAHQAKLEAERLSVSENHLKKLVRAGIIPAVKVGEI
jgi:hypothetical protein